MRLVDRVDIAVRSSGLKCSWPALYCGHLLSQHCRSLLNALYYSQLPNHQKRSPNVQFWPYPYSSVLPFFTGRRQNGGQAFLTFNSLLFHLLPAFPWLCSRLIVTATNSSSFYSSIPITQFQSIFWSDSRCSLFAVCNVERYSEM
jgi:hypothetical protein